GSRREGSGPGVEAPLSVAFARRNDVGGVRLEAPWRLRVVVRDAEGRLLKEARATAVPAERPGSADLDAVGKALVRRAVTDADGVAVLVDLPDGPVHVRVAHRGFVDAEAEVPG